MMQQQTKKMTGQRSSSSSTTSRRSSSSSSAATTTSEAAKKKKGAVAGVQQTQRAFTGVEIEQKMMRQRSSSSSTTSRRSSSSSSAATATSEAAKKKKGVVAGVQQTQRAFTGMEIKHVHYNNRVEEPQISSQETLKLRQQQQYYHDDCDDDVSECGTEFSTASSVAHLRNLLDGFGKKNHEHYQKNHGKQKLPLAEPVKRLKVRRSTTTVPPKGVVTVLPTMSSQKLAKRIHRNGTNKKGEGGTLKDHAGCPRHPYSNHHSAVARGMHLASRSFSDEDDDNVQATDKGYASVAKLSKWLADDPTISDDKKKKTRQVHLGANIMEKSKTFDKRLASGKVKAVPRRGPPLSKKLPADIRKKSAPAVVAVSSSVSSSSSVEENTATTMAATAKTTTTSMSVLEKKKWLSAAFQPNHHNAEESVTQAEEEVPRSEILSGEGMSLRAKQLWHQRALEQQQQQQQQQTQTKLTTSGGTTTTKNKIGSRCISVKAVGSDEHDKKTTVHALPLVQEEKSSNNTKKSTECDKQADEASSTEHVSMVDSYGSNTMIAKVRSSVESQSSSETIASCNSDSNDTTTEPSHVVTLRAPADESKPSSEEDSLSHKTMKASIKAAAVSDDTEATSTLSENASVSTVAASDHPLTASTSSVCMESVPADDKEHIRNDARSIPVKIDKTAAPDDDEQSSKDDEVAQVEVKTMSEQKHSSVVSQRANVFGGKVSSVKHRLAKFEKLDQENRRKSSTFGLLKPGWEDRGSHYAKVYKEDIVRKKSIDELP